MVEADNENDSCVPLPAKASSHKTTVAAAALMC